MINTDNVARLFGKSVKKADMNEVPKARRGGELSRLIGSDEDDGTNLMKRVGEWLPFAAERYNISRNIEDYVITPVPIVVSDIPNVSLISFSLDTLLRFNPKAGCLNYKTWAGKPTFLEHANNDWTKAKGAILDVSLIKMRNTADTFYKVVALCAFDRTVPNSIAETINSQPESAYSMGCTTQTSYCSVCGKLTENLRYPACSHVGYNPGGRPTLNFFPNGDPNSSVSSEPRLGYWNVGDFIGFEISYVRNPAFKGAKTNIKLDMGGSEDEKTIKDDFPYEKRGE